MAVELEFEGRFNGQELNQSEALPVTGHGCGWTKICLRILDISGQIVKFDSSDSKYIPEVEAS